MIKVKHVHMVRNKEIIKTYAEDEQGRTKCLNKELPIPSHQTSVKNLINPTSTVQISCNINQKPKTQLRLAASSKTLENSENHLTSITKRPKAAEILTLNKLACVPGLQSKDIRIYVAHLLFGTALGV